ncbi:MAG TPA: hypothetical protein VMF89_18790 [Polyangiales bacterium]|nr:hypothetical protein [Polyangiales bacterium]
MGSSHQPNKVAVQTIALVCGFALASSACGDDEMAVSALSADAGGESQDAGSTSDTPRRRTEWIAADGGSSTAQDAGKAQPQPPAAKRTTPPPVTSPPAAMDAAAPVVDAGTEADAGDDEDAGIDTPVRAQLIAFKPMYSAYDGVHRYQLTPSVPRAADDATDPVDPTTVKWTVDSTYVSIDPFPDLPLGVKLTTKRAGLTLVTVEATTRAGVRVRDEARLAITAVSPEAWEAGDQRFNVGTQVTWSPACSAPDELSFCMLPCATWNELPKTSACASCHNSTSSSPFVIEYTPTQTAGLSDDQLLSLFTQGARPNYTGFDSALLQEAEEPRCLFSSFHVWEIDDVAARGVIAQLRAIPPRAIEALDIPRIFATPTSP